VAAFYLRVVLNRQLHRITFDYSPAEAEIPIVTWFLESLDHKLEPHQANLTISDMNFGRGGLDISWYLTGSFTEDFESELEEQFEWVCRKANRDL